MVAVLLIGCDHYAVGFVSNVMSTGSLLTNADELKRVTRIEVLILIEYRAKGQEKFT